ncbi:unnamed protein product [Urochloa humidicola]
MAKLVDKAKGFIADKVAKVEKPGAELADVSVGPVGRDGSTLASHIDVRNLYSHAIPVCEISYSLRSAGREVASGTMPDPGSLAAGHHAPRRPRQGALRLPRQPRQEGLEGLEHRLRDARRTHRRPY